MYSTIISTACFAEGSFPDMLLNLPFQALSSLYLTLHPGLAVLHFPAASVVCRVCDF